MLSTKPQLLFNYFKQLFAQVTNPPIDPIREELVMSLLTYIGNKGNILAETPLHARLVKLQRPVLTDDELSRLRHIGANDFRAKVLPMEFPAGGDGRQLDKALKRLATDAIAAVRENCRILILSDRNPSPGTTPIPSLLATATVNRALSAAGLRPETGIVVESGEVREIMHYALLIGYGATAVNPYLALETVTGLARSGAISVDPVTAATNYINAVDKGLLKVMSKMGISTLRSYRSGQVFEAVGLSRELIDEYLPGTASRIGGIGLAEIAAEANTRRAEAQGESPLLPDGGSYRFRKDGEQHLWTPASLAAFRQAVQTGDYAKFKEYSKLIDDQAGHLCTLRGLFEFVETRSIPIEEVESVDSIVKRFVSGAMSLGSLSPEAHETIAIAMNRLGGMSNCGEGGEDSLPLRADSRGLQPHECDQADRIGPFRCDHRLSASRERSPDQDGTGRETGRGRTAPRSQGRPLHREAASLDAERDADLARRRTMTSIRSRISRSSSTICGTRIRKRAFRSNSFRKSASGPSPRASRKRTPTWCSSRVTTAAPGPRP